MKKGIVMNTTIEVIVAVLAVALVAGVAYKVLYPVFVNQESDSVNKMLDVVVARADGLTNGENNTFLVRGVADWYLMGWSKSDPSRPDKCFLNSCICACKGYGKDSCQNRGFCRALKQEQVAVFSTIVQNQYTEDSEADSPGAPPQRISLPPVSARIACVILPANLFGLYIEKTRTSVAFSLSEPDPVPRDAPCPPAQA